MTRTVKSQANEQEEDIYSEALLPSALPSALPNPISLDKINVKVEEDASEKMTQLSRSPRLGEEGNSNREDAADADCRVCDKIFKSKYGYTHHLKSKDHQRMLAREPLPPDALPDEFNQENYCRLCNRTYPNKKQYRVHLKKVHKMTLTFPTQRQRQINTDIPPDPNNPNFNCDSCSFTYSCKSAYLRHLKGAHKMSFAPQRLPRIKSFDLNIIPDHNDPNFYCRSCQVHYKRFQHFRRHIQSIHKIKLEPLRKKRIIFDPSITPNNTRDPGNTSCTICRIDYRSIMTYNHHMKTVHKNGNKKAVKGISRVNPNVKPDADDPNSYCRSCQYKFTRKGNYHFHIQQFHPEAVLDLYPQAHIQEHDISFD